MIRLTTTIQYVFLERAETAGEMRARVVWSWELISSWRDDMLQGKIIWDHKPKQGRGRC